MAEGEMEMEVWEKGREVCFCGGLSMLPKEHLLRTIP